MSTSQVIVDPNDSTTVIGYECSQLVANNANQLVDFDLIFYIDAATPINEQTTFVEHMQKELVPLIGTRYGIRSDAITGAGGLRCMSPPIDGTSWLLKFTLETKDFKVVDVFKGCRTLSSSSETQDCNFYEITIRGSYIGNGNSNSNKGNTPNNIAALTAIDLKDVVDFLELTVDSTALTNGLNNALYETKFDGVPVLDDSTNANDAGRDNLNTPVNDGSGPDGISTAQQTQSSGTDRTTITIVGGLLVAAFVLAFVGICFILWRRRQYFIRSRQIHMSQWENGQNGEGGPDLEQDGEKGFEYGDDDNGVGGPGVVEKGSGLGDLERYNTSNTEEEKEDDYADEILDAPQQMNGQAVESSQGIGDDGPNGGGMQFDLGSSFKDQLMGVHGSRGGNSTSSSKLPPGAPGSNASKRGSQLGSMFPATHSIDGDSDADSWAQTDGTIGSLEIGLEPITAEI